jgi:P pilus assembly chaperone PapD
MRLFLAFCLTCAYIAHAGFSVTPAVLKIPVHKGEYAGWVDVAHTGGTKPVAVELVMHERILDIDGNPVDTVVINKDFVIYPVRILLSPGQAARAQVIYRGKEKIESDKSYFMLAKEVPLPNTGGKEDENKITVGLSVKINYNVAILMDTNKPGVLTFVSSKKLDSSLVELIMENKSNGIFQLKDVHILANGKKITEFTGRKNSVMPGQKRRFIFKHEKPLTAEEVKFVK